VVALTIKAHSSDYCWFSPRQTSTASDGGLVSLSRTSSPPDSSRLERSSWRLDLTKKRAGYRYVSSVRCERTASYPYQGAGEISKYLLSTFGEQAFAFIVDEGGASFSSLSQKVVSVTRFL